MGEVQIQEHAHLNRLDSDSNNENTEITRDLGHITRPIPVDRFDAGGMSFFVRANNVTDSPINSGNLSTTTGNDSHIASEIHYKLHL